MNDRRMTSSLKNTKAAEYAFAVIIRTTGKRNDSLAEALQSVAFQHLKCLAVVVTHGTDTQILSEVDSVCKEINTLDYVLLHATDTHKKRGYPLNVGLDYCYNCGFTFDAIFFLDDDDIVYPFFTQKMRQAFDATDADVIYSASNQRHLGSQPEEAYRPKHISYLFIENFIPINSYSVCFRSLKENNLLFDESLEYTEDWHFLLRLLEKGLRFEALHETLSEFRMTSDGNAPVKQHPDIWKKASLEIRSYINKTKFPVNGYVLASSVMSINPRVPAQDAQIISLQNQVSRLEAQIGQLTKEKGELEAELVCYHQLPKTFSEMIWIAFKAGFRRIRQMLVHMKTAFRGSSDT
ncbi:glycosyltransferase family 2 protein [Desulfonema magnum]|uniref:Glycosyltransferase 2-like domain-containing protein n=1 Tax=Desulfonema magnum TaxID=45655 RepID=A0A975GK82_9BACT|nr:hypothetical protein [Desulfonema magnum]QTA84464.1 Uncharacterized protein dnm_004600 [Desulfonema magnum]